MFRSYLTAACRHLSRNWLHSGVVIFGLAVGIAAALMIALFLDSEFHYDEIPLHERTYLLRTALNATGLESDAVDRSPSYFATAMKLDFPQIEAIARLAPTIRQASFRKGEIENNEVIYWGDPGIFDVLRVPALAGDPSTALQNPNSVVITRKIAMKYFGRENPVGDTFEFNRQHVLTVTAVLEDRPPNSQLQFDIVISGRSAFSNLAEMDAHPGGFLVSCLTYFRLAPGASASNLEQAMPAFMARHHIPASPPPGFHATMFVTPLNAVHLAPGLDPITKPHARLDTLMAVASVGLLIVVIAVINFVNLMTTGSFQRATEVGVRKLTGARRRDLVLQFVGESFLYVVIASVLALALAEIALPVLSASIDRQIDLQWWRKESYLGIFGAFVFAISILGGAYPALALSAFRPALVLKGWSISGGGSVTVRRSLVVVQFAALIGLVVTTAIVYQQTQFALNEGMRLNKDEVYLVRTDCNGAFKDEVAALAGVRAVACSSAVALGFGELGAPVRLSDGKTLTVMRHPVDFGFFELYGLRPIAGRFFSRDHVSDALSPGAPMNVPVVVNETAARKFGFADPAQAVGATLRLERYRAVTAPSVIIGIVPDFQLASARTEVPPTIFFVDQSASALLSVKLSGREIPETLKQIDVLWGETGATGPINRVFLEQYVEDMYRDIRQQSYLFAAFSAIALLISCMGLFALSTYTVAQRTKEIGIRKALGASSGAILRLLTWEFAKPVIGANLIAWPIAYYAMERWLAGFAYHVEVESSVFLAAGILALAIALATVSTQAMLAAHSKPVDALRYE